MNKLKDYLSYYELEKTDKTDKIAQQLKKHLKTSNEWIPDFNRGFLPSFKWGKKKHNNRTGVNTFNSNTKVKKSFGRKKVDPLGYICNFESEQEANKVQNTLRDLEIYVPLEIPPTTGSFNIRIEFSQANKFIYLYPSIYIASKTKHFQKWIDLRNSGKNIVSTWIDEAGEGQTKDKKELCSRVIDEITKCDFMLVYVEDGEFLKGALIEMGIAMSFNIPIIMIGRVLKPDSVFTHYHSIYQCSSIEDGLQKIKDLNK